METTASTAFVVAIVAVVLGGIGLIGGVIGYVQGTSAVARATHARQRAVVAEEEALQARVAAEATARAAEELVERTRTRVRPIVPQEEASPEPAPDLLPTTSGAMLLPETTGPTVLPVLAEPEPEPESEPGDRRPAEAVEAAPEPEPVLPPEEPASTRDDQGRVVAGEQAAPTMDWAEVLKTDAIPLPSISRGTYSAPRRRPKPTGEGPARFELRAIGRQRFEAVNVGGEPAVDAQVEGGGHDPHLVRPLSARPSTVAPAAALSFSVLRVEGRSATAVVRWTRDGEPAEQDLPLD